MASNKKSKKGDFFMSDYEYKPDDIYDIEPKGDDSRSSRYSYIPDEPVRDYKSYKKKNSFFSGALKAAGFALIFGLVSGITFAGVNVAKDKLFPQSSRQIEVTTSDDSKKDTGDDSADNAASTAGSGTTVTRDVSAVVDKVMPSVVSVTGTYRTSDYFGFGSRESQGAGSGFLIAEDDNRLLIATNNHVVADSTSLTVGFVDNTTAKATVVGKDSNADLAVISVNKKDISDDTAKKIKIATLGDSEKLKVGQSVIVIGNAMGYGQSVTMGVLSAKDREVSFTDGTMTLLQTDAAINPGNSGGVMINLDGEVVGVSNAKLVDTSVESVCYAIPISTAKSVLTDLMNAGEISKDDASFLGIVGKNIDSSYSQALNMPQGIYVSKVIAGSPAEKAGISAGDIITAMDGNNLSTMNGLIEKLSIKKAGTKVTITLKRAKQNGEYEEKNLEVTLGKASDFKDETKENQSGNDNSQNQNGNGNNPFGNNGNESDDSDEFYFDNGNGNGGSFDPFEYFFN